MPNKAQLEADHHQRLTTRFSLKDATSGRPVTAHQTFVRLMNIKTKQEVIYVAEEDSPGTYRFDLVCTTINEALPTQLFSLWLAVAPSGERLPRKGRHGVICR